MAKMAMMEVVVEVFHDAASSYLPCYWCWELRPADLQRVASCDWEESLQIKLQILCLEPFCLDYNQKTKLSDPIFIQIHVFISFSLSCFYFSG